jgi:hypothetical protein
MSNMPNDSAAQILWVLSVRGPQLNEALRIFGIVFEIPLLHPTRIEADLPAAVEDNLLILLLVDVAEVDGVEVLEKVLESDPEAAIVKCFPI